MVSTHGSTQTNLRFNWFRLFALVMLVTVALIVGGAIGYYYAMKTLYTTAPYPVYRIGGQNPFSRPF